MCRGVRSHAQRPPQVEGITPNVPRSSGLLDCLLLLDVLVKLGRQRLTDALAECLFDEAAGVATFAAHEAFGLHAGLSGRRDSDLNGLGRHAAPPI